MHNLVPGQPSRSVLEDRLDVADAVEHMLLPGLANGRQATIIQPHVFSV